MKMFITLSNSGGELDRKEVEQVDEDTDQDAMSAAIYDALEAADWTLADGDIIRVITEE